MRITITRMISGKNKMAVSGLLSEVLPPEAGEAAPEEDGLPPEEGVA